MTLRNDLGELLVTIAQRAVDRLQVVGRRGFQRVAGNHQPQDTVDAELRPPFELDRIQQRAQLRPGAIVKHRLASRFS